MIRLIPDNTYLADPARRGPLEAWLRPSVLAWAEPPLVEMGRAAAQELQAWGEECEATPARLRAVEPWGKRVDEVVRPGARRRIGAPGRDQVEGTVEELAGLGPEVAQRHPPRLALGLGEAWIGGMLRSVEGAGGQLVADLRESGCRPGGGADRFEMVLGGD